MNKTTIAMLLCTVVLGILWFGTLRPAGEGYGYPGHNNNPGGGFFYWGSAIPYGYGTGGYGDERRDRPSARRGSIGGPGGGGGTRGGK